MSRRHPEPKKLRPSTITIPDRVGPHVKLVFAEMRRLGQTYDNVEAGSGVNRPTIKAWRHKNRPNLDSIEAVLGFLGWDFVPVPRSKVLPAEVENELRDVAARLDLTMPQTIQALVEVVTGIHGRFGSGPHAAESARTPERSVEPAPRRRARPVIHPDQATFFEAASHAVH
ncbi:hypothetical protein PMNALOAF_2698 [Methylobacterium adhaesivum]|uniref:XRE family transcriptional regulator n=1 Tax=Methylobacterium adhaesivum TaxID=333297 RepID=A0ABT8BIR4_9HYPH|nr:hypothetical protein [Methylobacterium adhaesivum]MDN3592052.1 hypothetical protein [Methylobacterium adhaesivum]GJD31439.1 hypothetical protein PMNALOAF_2698 [Methylobacterium adhaesivum]